jgi:hypothetical protein
MREFTASPKETRKRLADNGQLIVTNNGAPAMLVIDITNKDFLKMIDYLRRQEAMDILHQIQTDSVRSDKDNISMEEIDEEIAVFRQEKRGGQ